jgi:hypothetical protein
MRADSRSARIRQLALASIAGQIVWLGAIVLAGLLEPGYSEIRDAVSVLGADTAARAWLFNAAAAIWGASFIAAAVALALDAPRGWRGWIGPALIALTGLAQILDGFPFPADCRPTIDPSCLAREQAGDVSWQHVAHGWTYFLGAVALALSLLAMAWRFRDDPRWGRADLLALAAGLLGLVVVTGLFFGTDDGTGAHYGLVQRVALAGGGNWVGSLTIGLLAIHGRGRDPAVRCVEWIRALPGGRLVVRPGSGLQAPSRRG